LPQWTGAGTAWLEKRILSALKLKLGDPLTVGEKQLTIAISLPTNPTRKGFLQFFSTRDD